MVDYALCIDPDRNPGEFPRQQTTSARLLNTVTYTDYDAICRRDVAFDVETRRDAYRATKADASTAIWHTAQWKFLETPASGAIRNLSSPPCTSWAGLGS